MASKMDLSTPLEYGDPAWDGTVVDISSTDYSVPAPGEARKLWVGGAGNVTLVMAGGTTLTFSAVPAGTMMLVVFSKVVKATTTATLMLALT